MVENLKKLEGPTPGPMQDGVPGKSRLILFEAEREQAQAQRTNAVVNNTDDTFW